MTASKKRFELRAFVAAMACFSGLGLPATGLANHLCGASPMTMERHAWMSAHNSLGVLFVVFSIWHVVLNRRALVKHLRNAAGRVPWMSREAAIAGAVVGLVTLVLVGHAFHAGP